MDSVAFLVLNVEKAEFVDELPVASQMLVGGGAESWSLGIGEVRLHVNKRRYAALALVLPDLAHEGSVEIRLAAQQRVDGWVTQDLGEHHDLCGPIEDRA